MQTKLIATRILTINYVSIPTMTVARRSQFWQFHLSLQVFNNTFTTSFLTCNTSCCCQSIL